MANEFVARKGLIISGSTRASGSITATSFTGSILGTASQAISSSYVPNLYITASDAAPTAPDINELWYDSTTGKTYIYYRSASVLQWVLQSDPTYDPGPSIQDLQDVTDVGSTTTNAITITNTTTAVDSSSGALIVSGGVGIKGALYANTVNANTITATSFVGSLTGTATTASYVTFANVANKPTLVSASAQINTGSFTGSFIGVHTGSLFASTGSIRVDNGSIFIGGVTSSDYPLSIDVARYSGNVIELKNTSTVESAIRLTNGTPALRFSVKNNASAQSDNIVFAPNNVDLISLTTYDATAPFTGKISSQVQNLRFVNVNTIAFRNNADTSHILLLRNDLSAAFSGSVSASVFTGSFVGNLTGTGSWAQSASVAVTSSFVLPSGLPSGVVSSSTQFNSLTSPFTGSFTGSFVGGLTGTGSWASSASVAVSSSYALTASYALNGGTGGTSGNSFVTFSIAGQSDVVADSSNDTLTLAAGSGITLTTNASTDTITITATAGSPQAFNTDRYTFIGDGATVNYNVVNSYAINSLLVSVDGLTYTPTDDYTISTNTLTFVSAPPSQSNILVTALVNATTGVTGSFTGSFAGAFTGTSSWAVSASWSPGGAGTVTSVAAGDGLSGGTITSAGTISLNTGSTHFLDGVKKELNTEGVVSSSTQFTSLTAPFTGSFTGSFRGSLIGTSSWADSASRATTASFAVSASWAPAPASSGVTSITAGNGLTGGTITSTGTITLDTGSTHFLDGVKKELNTENVVSSSTQFTSLTAPFTGSFTGSFRGNLTGTGSWADSASRAITSSFVLPSGLPSGVVSSSTQFTSLTAPFTGSFTGSFSGSLDRFSPVTLRVTVGTTAPSSPAVNDLWVDTN